MVLRREIVRQFFGTFVAVLSGWIAGILFGVPLALFDLVRDPAHASPWELVALPYLFGVGAPIFIVPVWVFALIPLYFLVPRSSPLWRPAICASVGAAAGICIMAWSFAQPNTNPPEEKWSWYVEAAVIAGVTCYTGAAMRDRFKRVPKTI
jgi:uncharacterized BrkB/YihY/UPF0761 family membrane protein